MRDPVHVLLLEGEPAVAERIETALLRAHDALEVHTVATADAALDHLDEQPADAGVDCIVAGHEPPERDGLSLLRAVREDRPTLPFILFPGQGSERVAADALSAGATAYVLRDGGSEAFDRLADTVGSAVERSGAARDAARSGAARSDAAPTDATPTRFEERFRALYTNAPVPVVSGGIEADGEHFPVTEVNAAFEDTFGFDAVEVVGRDVAQVLVPTTGRDEHSTIRERVASGEAVVTEATRHTVDGDREFVLQVVPYGTETLPAAGWFAWYTDVSGRRRRQAALERLHEATRDLLEAPDEQTVAEITSETARDIVGLPLNAVFLYDEAQDALLPAAWTDAGVEFLEGEPPTIHADEGVAWTAFATGEVQHYADVRDAPEVLNPDTPFRSEVTAPLGEHGVLMASSTAVGDFDDTDLALISVLAANVTAALDRLARERTLAEERNRYATLVEESHDGIVIHVDGRIVFANQRAAELLGYDDPDALTGTSFLDFVAPSDRELVEERYTQRLDPDQPDPPAQYEARYLTRTGEERVSEVTGAAITDDGERADLVTVRDITERHEYRRRLEETTEELEALNRLVRHDIRNDVSVILGWAQLLEDHVDEEGAVHLAKILASGERIVELTETARDYIEVLTSGGAVDTVPTPLRSTLETEVALRREAFPHAEIIVEGPIPDVDVRANEMLGAVFRNLLYNAVQHNDTDAPVVTVSVEQGDDTVRVNVADDGPGVGDDQKETIFAKGEKGIESAGTGIGLFLVQTLVDQYDGDVRVGDNEPRGAVFTVELPLVA